MKTMAGAGRVGKVGPQLENEKTAAMNPLGVFKAYCARQGMRFTPERRAIIEEIYRDNAHFDVDGLYLRIRLANPDMKLAKGSVYRTIPHLMRASLLRASLADDGRVRYEQTLGQTHHDHIQCVRCGKILEFHDGTIDRIQEEICAGHGFEMLWHTHVIRGYCAECRKGLVDRSAEAPLRRAAGKQKTKQEGESERV